MTTPEQRLYFKQRRNLQKKIDALYIARQLTIDRQTLGDIDVLIRDGRKDYQEKYGVPYIPRITQPY